EPVPAGWNGKPVDEVPCNETAPAPDVRFVSISARPHVILLAHLEPPAWLSQSISLNTAIPFMSSKINFAVAHRVTVLRLCTPGRAQVRRTPLLAKGGEASTPPVGDSHGRAARLTQAAAGSTATQPTGGTRNRRDDTRKVAPSGEASSGPDQSRWRRIE